ncbi:GNAT family N-acetyltransferase [Variovorax sp. RHLX14]|uniref:GNAT family N-acetyltransferase n=1 Tax=Variovorax sp. RHLX14 TaxID=1259731 RepID=UPI003F45D6F1
MSHDILIRPVTAADFEKWTPLWQRYNAFYGRSGETALPESITDATWARFLAPEEPMHALVAESADGIVGLAHFLFHRSTIQLNPTCYLQDLFTTESARGKGVARALIEAVYQHAADAGAARVYWQTHETNRTAMQLYDKVAEKSGFLVYRKLL